jgi:4-diphosphocytidyl-2-C-methyl-D-erythritol kinase
MHPICSWMVTVDLFDDLEVTRLKPDRFSRYAILWHEDAPRRSEIDWSITKDLAVRAHLAMQRHVRRKLPVQLKLEKRIPVGGGLGGGSSDAAAMLHAVNMLYELGLNAAELAQVGAEIGSDVPFLVHGGSAIVEGLGDRLERHEGVPDLHAVVVFPAASCPTGEVYGRFDDLEPGPLRDEAVRAMAAGMPRGPGPDGPFNDLAAAAMKVVPELAEDLRRLAEVAERPAHVSGSGSSLFVLCDDPMHAAYLARAISERCGLPAVAVAATAGHPERSAAEEVPHAGDDRIIPPHDD